MTEPQANVRRRSPSPSTDEGGWSTGNESSYSSEMYDEVSLEDGSEEQEHESQWRYVIDEEDEEEEILEDTLSYDAIEDGSEWVSDSEKVSRNEQILPRYEESSDEESSTWRFELSPSTTTYHHQESIASRDENVATRLESMSARDGFDGEDVLDDKEVPSSSPTIILPHRAATESRRSASQGPYNADLSQQDHSDSESRASTSDSPDRLPSIPLDSSQSTSQNKSGSSSDLFILSSSSIHTSEGTKGSFLESSKSTSDDTSSAVGIALSSSTSDRNLLSESKKRRPRRQPLASKRSSYLATKIASIPPRTSTHENNLSNSESTEPPTPPSPSNILRQRPSHPSRKRHPKTKRPTRKPASNRSKSSRKKSSFHPSKPVETPASQSGVVKNTIGKSETKIGSSPKSRSPDSARNRTTPRKEVQPKTGGFRKGPSSSQVERQRGTGNSAKTSFNPKVLALNSSDFSKSVSFLNNYNCGLKTTKKEIHATINNEGYKMFVKTAYYKLLEARPRLKYLLSLSEWVHVQMLLLYARMFDCELHFYDIILPREFRIAIPDDIMVFEPIAAVLSSIGIVDQADIGITYIPVARSYRGNDVYKPHNKDDVTEFLEWNQYDWNSSWYQVEEARLERRMMAAEKNINIPKPETQFDHSKLEEWQQLAVEKWLGWDEDLWFSYKQACYVLGRSGHFVSIPRDRSKHGSYSWLLPRHTSDEGAFVRIPRPNLSHDCWMIAIMLDMCALEPMATATWYHETNTVDDVQHLIDCFLGAAMMAT